MAGILANSVAKQMLSGDTTENNSVSGYVVGDPITLSVTPTGTNYQWGEAIPVSSAPARSQLKSPTDASPSFIPDVAGQYVITVVVDLITTYVIQIAVVDISPVTFTGGLEMPAVSDVSIPSPSVGLTVYNSIQHSGFVTKDPSGTIGSFGGGGGSGNVTGPNSSITKTLPRYAGTSGKIIDESLVTVDDSGNITVPALATFDGRDVSVDGAKLDGVAAGADVTLTALAAASAAISVNGQRISNGGTPTQATDFATKAYTDAHAAGLLLTNGAVASSLTNITLSGIGQSVDGVTITDGMRVAPLGQTDQKQNGIYAAASGAWSRVSDLATGSHAAGAIIFISQGTLRANTSWACTATNPNDVVDTNNLPFTQFSGGGSITVDSTLTQSGNQIGVKQATANPQPPGTAAPGTSNKSAREDHTHDPPSAAQVVTALGSAATSVSVNGQEVTNGATPTQSASLATKGYVDGLAAPTYIDTPLYQTAAAHVARNFALSDNSVTHVLVKAFVRDTGVSFYELLSSTTWTRASGSGSVLLSDNSPAATNHITGFTGVSLVANSNGVDVIVDNTSAGHVRAYIETFVETIPLIAAT